MTSQDRFRRWRAVRDLRTCVVCYELHGQIIDTFDPIAKGLGPPRHMRCRCQLQPIALEDLPPNLRVRARDRRPVTVPPWQRVRDGVRMIRDGLNSLT